jgi:hypothetical protein
VAYVNFYGVKVQIRNKKCFTKLLRHKQLIEVKIAGKTEPTTSVTFCMCLLRLRVLIIGTGQNQLNTLIVDGYNGIAKRKGFAVWIPKTLNAVPFIYVRCLLNKSLPEKAECK